MDVLVERLRHGGIESVPADDIEECSDERCADIKGACGDKVGTCWVEARCGGGRSQDDQVKVEPPLVPNVSRGTIQGSTKSGP